jgi:ribosomal protein L44E
MSEYRLKGEKGTFKSRSYIPEITLWDDHLDALTNEMAEATERNNPDTADYFRQKIEEHYRIGAEQYNLDKEQSLAASNRRISRYAGGVRSNKTNRLSKLAKGTKAFGYLGFLATPGETTKNVRDVFSGDEDRSLKGAEGLLGLPRYFTGRSMTEEEMEDEPVWYDPRTRSGGI